MELILTAKNTDDRLTKKDNCSFKSEPTVGVKMIEVHRDVTFQEIEGFGGAFTEAGGYNLAQLSPAKREEILRAYFHPEEGLGYNLCRTHINSCDFALGNYAYNEVPGDVTLETFDISRDREYLLPFIHAAKGVEGADFRLLASPWSPPAWMKSNQQMNHGGKLLPEYRDTWALYYTKYIQAYREEEGIEIWGVSVQNEPEATQVWDSCRYTTEEEKDFVRDHLGPTMEKAGLSDVKIVVWDHNRDLLYERAKGILSDPQAAQYIWGVGMHWYSGDQFENVAKVYQEFPDHKLLFTEGCIEGGVQLGAWHTGERYGHHIIGDLNHGTVGWIDWNMVLDTQGGPNHVGNYCDAPVIVDPKTDQVIYESSFYYLGHFSKYIRPHAKRIGVTTELTELEVTAFKNVDGRVAMVVMNAEDDEIVFQIKDQDQYGTIVSPGHSIITILF